MANIFLTYLGISATVGIVVLIILLASPLINRRYAAKWKYYIWIFLAIRLLIPISGMYHKEPKIQPSAVSSNTVCSSDTVVYEPVGIPDVQPRRFVVEIPVGTAGQVTQTPDTNSVRPKLSLFDIVFSAWIAGIIIFTAVPLISCLHCKYRITHGGERLEAGEAYEIFLRMKSRLKIKRNVWLIRYPKAASPMIIGFIKPALVLPCDDLSTEELQFIIRHELIHLKRGDVYIKLLCVLANAVHWFNPLVWIMRREAAIDMELSCDDGVIKGKSFDVRRAYTETLMSSLRRQSAKRSSLTTQFYGGKSTMKKRFTNILGNRAKKNGIAVLIIAVVLATLLGVLVGCTQKTSMPSDDELVRLINNYLEFEAICTYTNLPVDFDNPPSDDPSNREHWIYPVTKEGMTTWEDWLNYLSGIFAESRVEEALEKTSTRYINYNGNLYYSDGGMGWNLSSEYCIARTKQNGSTTFTVEFWREYDPDFGGSSEREFRITALDFEYTSAGWRISDYSDRDSTPADSNPNLSGFNPYGTEGNVPADETAPTVTDFIDDEMNLPQGYVYNTFEGRVGQLEHGGVSFKNHDESAAFGFILPENWSLDASVANCNNVKVFEIGGFFKTEELSSDKVMVTDGNADFPTTAKNDEGGTVTIYAEKMSDAGVYDYMCHSSSVLGNGEIYEKYIYIVSRGGYSVYVTFVVNDYYSDEICETVLNSFAYVGAHFTASANAGDMPAVEPEAPVEPTDETTSLANDILANLERDRLITVNILAMNKTEPVMVIEGVDQYGNLREIDGATYIPMQEDYDTIDEIMEAFHKVYTNEKCETLYSQYLDENNTGFMKEIDGKLYCIEGDMVLAPYNLPIDSAERISETEILAKTTKTYDTGDVPYEITLKYEDGVWKIDKLIEYMSEEGREESY